jgi:hypothetical protein
LKRVLIAAVAAVLALSGCTEKVRTRNFGGTSTTTLPACQKLVMITWKEANMWTLTRHMTAADKAESYRFQEDSNFGIAEGTVIINEQKGPGCQ